MVKLDARPGPAPGGLTVAISGRAVFTCAGELEQALGQALADCEHLTLDLTRLEQIDPTFPALVCCLHRTGELLKKTVSLKGPLKRPRLISAGRAARCPRLPGRPCGLWVTLDASGHPVPAGSHA